MTKQDQIESLMDEFHLFSLVALESSMSKLLFIKREINGNLMAGYWNSAKTTGGYHEKLVVKCLDGNSKWEDEIFDAFAEKGYETVDLWPDAHNNIERIIVKMRHSQPPLTGLREVTSEFGNSFQKTVFLPPIKSGAGKSRYSRVV
jgi:hypothetical protein